MRASKRPAIRSSTFLLPLLRCATVKLLHLFLLAIIATALSACASGGKKKSSMHMYDGDSSPSIRMYDERPGSELHN